MDCGALRVDVASREVSLQGNPVVLTRLEFDLIAHLAANQGRTVSREQLLDAVWHSSARWQTTATVTEHVSRVRSKLGSDETTPRITSVRGVGYRFDPPSVATPMLGADLSDSAGAPPAGAVVVLVGESIVDATAEALAVFGINRKDDIVGHDVFEFVARQSLPAGRARMAWLTRTFGTILGPFSGLWTRSRPETCR